MAKKKKRKKRTIYKAITFKVSARQKKSLEAYCKEHKIGMLRMIRKSVQEYLNRPEGETKSIDYVSANQLDLFIEAQLASEDQEDYKKATK
jgi:hypothetical protein